MGREADQSHPVVPRLRMSGSVPPLPLCAFIVCTETNIFFVVTGYGHVYR